MKALVLVLALSACGKKSGPADLAVADVKEELARDEIRVAALTLGKLRPEAVVEVAPQVAADFVAHWPKVREYMLDVAKTAGIARARGAEASTDQVAEVLAAIASVSPELDAKWKPLVAETTAAEAAAHDAELADPRPFAQVVAVQDEAILLGSCTVKAMTAHYPAYRWELATKRTAKIALTITTETALAHYSGGGAKTTAMMTGMRATFTPLAVTGFEQPITTSGDVDAPDEIAGDTSASVQTGMGLMRRITTSICADLEAKLH